MVLNQRVLHEVLKAKEWISIIKDKVFLGGALGVDFFRNPAKTLTRIRNPLQILSRMRLARLWFESRENFRTITKILCRFE
jgi:hypothetical protein